MNKPTTDHPDAKSQPVPCQCEVDPIGCLKQMFVDMVQLGRIKAGQCPAKRPVFLRLHGVAHGRFEVVPDLPEDLRVGLFGQRMAYPAWVRYSSDIPDGVPDLKSTVGIGIKLFDVAGDKMLPPQVQAPTLDILLQNMDVFFVNDAHDMCAFTRASLTGAAAADAWLKAHPETQRILDAMQKVVPSVLETDLWSVIPFRFGDQRYCKYKLEPELVPPGPAPDYDDPDYLRIDLEQRLNNGEARFRFMVQLQTDPATMPLDKAMVPWSEEASPPIHVATLILPRQDITARGQSNYGETLAFNPWRTLAVHEPVGSIAEARKVVYRASAELRRDVNGEPLGEPIVPRPDTVWPAAKDTRVVRAAIYPGIGIARIGNSKAPDGFYIGPEVTHPPLTLAGETRDATGALKRQAARFRLYGYNAAGEVVGELTPDNAEIVWQAHLVNRKAQWFQFQVAMDIPEAATVAVPLRNPHVSGVARDALAIDPGVRHIQGKNTSGAAYQFDTGRFQGVPVPLGELRTDEHGHLLVLGGLGASASPEGMPIYDPANPSSFNNANGWYDDISDGPVRAAVSINGQAIPVDSAWAVVAPPNYAPDVIGWRTLYDLLVDTYVECGWLPFPETVSFTQDVLPALARLTNLQWVNKGFAALFGRGGQFDFNDPTLIAKLAYTPAPGQSDPYAELRQVIFNCFRPASNTVDDVRLWPWLYGDAEGSSSVPTPRNNLALSKVREALLQRWVRGDFVNDWSAEYTPPQTLAEVPLADQPAMLDQAALHFCLADAFHPGCELTWPMRHASLYRAPFRIRERPEGVAEPDYGTTLTQPIALSPGGPLYAQGPGDLSRWMALPWQGDTAFCRSGYDHEYDPYLPSFWPARVPNQVLSDADYRIVINEALPREQRIAAFNRRANWLRALLGTPANPTPAPQVMMLMVQHFAQLGIVEARPGVENDPDFPPVIFVESLAGDKVPPLLQAVFAAAAAHDEPTDDTLSRAGWASAEQREEFLRIVRP